MKLVLSAALVLVALAFAVPMMAGGSANICLDVMMHSGTSPSGNGGQINSATMFSVIDSNTQNGGGNPEQIRQARLHPNIPPVLSCTAAFWKSALMS